jgi:hypothetical protein
MNLADHLKASELFMRLALKSQSQCRATIETLAAVKNPPSLAFVKQANIANGHQQVNNGLASPARENVFSTNEVLEPHEQLDQRTTQAPSLSNSKVATLGTIDRTENIRREGPSEPQQPKARRAIA